MAQIFFFSEIFSWTCKQAKFWKCMLNFIQVYLGSRRIRSEKLLAFKIQKLQVTVTNIKLLKDQLLNGYRLLWMKSSPPGIQSSQQSDNIDSLNTTHFDLRWQFFLTLVSLLVLTSPFVRRNIWSLIAFITWS